MSRDPESSLDEDTLTARMRAVRMLVLDVDGVLTDGGIYLGQSEELKRFHVRDGAGIKLLANAGLTVTLITGRESVVVRRRAEELGLTELHQAVRHKWPVLEEILERHGLEAEQVAAMGDDITELPLFRRVGLAVAVADAHEELRSRAHYVTRAPGGRGAVRELADQILKARGDWDGILANYNQ